MSQTEEEEGRGGEKRLDADLSLTDVKGRYRKKNQDLPPLAFLAFLAFFIKKKKKKQT